MKIHNKFVSCSKTLNFSRGGSYDVINILEKLGNKI